ncbi:outer membrane protein [Sphaerotilus hippei]|uniref:Outer membrane protein n=1 Tax=Sphaerotilus hippei TaxID=744406 RepID=A0A318GUT7_9BURK|nr:MipA/OmpV family protein [Sphaerotilus hippei]PXW91974.1 outer membrane protein [Sphaerotilus hippei]
MYFTSRPPLIAAFTLAMTLHSAVAQAESPPKEEKNSRWGLGLGIGRETSPYRSVKTDTKILPLLTFENDYARLFGPSLDVKLPSAGLVSFTLRARYSDAGYEASDAAELQGMEKRNGGLWLGARTDLRLPLANLSAEWLGDASNRSGGQQIRLEASHRSQFGSVNVMPRLAMVWQDSSYVDYYYGIRATESRVGRAAYDGTSSINTELGLRMNISLAPKHSTSVDVSHTILGSSIKDSPLVGRSGISAVRASYLYSF